MVTYLAGTARRKWPLTGMRDTTSPLEETVFETLADTSSDGGISQSVAKDEARNFVRHTASLGLTKTADGLIDPKLVLSWLLTHLGAPAYLVGLLVPVREAGALLPQLFSAPYIRAMARRKWAWAAGSAMQGVSAAVIALAGLWLEGALAGVVIVTALTALALGRSVCSVSYKDVLGKTIGKSRRGTVTGTASSIASVAVMLFAAALLVGVTDRLVLVLAAITLAAAFWMTAAALFVTLTEDNTPSDTPEHALADALGQMRLLSEDRQLRLFIWTRGLLVGTALAPPFLVLLASGAAEAAFSQLGAMVLASSLAAFLSSYVWGRLADVSSKRVLTLSGVSAALALGLALVLDALGLFGTVWAAPVTLFLLMIAYNGVRQGRSTHLVDMAPDDQRAAYTAVSNTVIGLVLMGAGVFGAIASSYGPAWTIGLFALMSVAGALVSLRLKEVQSS